MATTSHYWSLLDKLNIPAIYKGRGGYYLIETHGSHTVNGVQLIPGAIGFNPETAYKLWMSLLFPPIRPDITSLRLGEAGISVTLNTSGTLMASVSGSLGGVASGTTLLVEQSTVKEGFLTLHANGQTSSVTSQFVILGTVGDDSIDARVAGSRVDYIFGGAGNDTIRAGEGDDILQGGTGNDTLLGNEGDDLIYGGEGNDSIQAGQGNDTVYGGDGDDVVNGGTTGDDVLNGGAGNDQITGGAGADTLSGGDGNDRFYFALSGDLFASGQAVDSIDGGAGTNTLVLADSTLGVQDSFDITTTSSWSRISNASRIEAEGPYSAQFNLALSDDAYEAGLRVIDLSADTQTNFNANFINVSAETGVSNGYTLIGHGGMDFITGGAGNDTIQGGDGNDVLRGGSGADSLTGGYGNDRFDLSVLDDWNAGKTITDFATTSVNNNVLTNQALNINGDALQFDLSVLQGIAGYATLATPTPTGSNVSTLVAADFVLVDNINDAQHDLPIASTAAHAQFIYDNWTKAVYFDADGTGGTATPTIIVGNITYTGLTSGMILLVA